MSAAGRPVSTVALFVVVDQKVELRAANAEDTCSITSKCAGKTFGRARQRPRGRSFLVSAHAKGFESVAITS